MNIFMYNDLDIERIKFGNKPYKKIKTIDTTNGPVVKSIYYIDMIYDDQPIYVQIPRYQLSSLCLQEQLMTLTIDKYFYHDFIQTLEDYIIDVVYKNSERWFGGKRFTIDKITSCIVSNAEKLHDDSYVLTVSIGKGLRIYDRFRKSISLEEFVHMTNNYTETVCILCIQNLQFVDNRFICNITVEQIKFYNDQPLVEYTIRSDNNTSVSDNNTSVSDNDTSVDRKDVADRKNVTGRKNDTDTESEASILEDEYYGGE